MKIAYCLFGTYTVGGIERTTTVKANWLAQHGHDLYLITTGHNGRPSYYSLEPNIKHIDLDINYIMPGASFITQYRGNRSKPKLHEQRLRELLLKLRPDITIAAGWHEAGFLHRIEDGSAKIVEHHNFLYAPIARFPTFYDKNNKLPLLSRLKYWLRTQWSLQAVRQQRYHDQRYDRLVVLTEEDKALCSHCPNASVIYNPRTIESDVVSPLTNKIILATGRLTGQKNFTELVHIWGMIAKEYPDWKLYIVGDGESKEEIKEAIRSVGIEDQVELLPFSNNIQEHYLSASIFAMPSTYEGFGLVLVEAETCGLPVVSYACPCGPRDIIRHGEDGFLVNPGDKKAFAQHLRQLIESEELRQAMGRAARANSERFALDVIMKQWEQLFEELRPKR